MLRKDSGGAGWMRSLIGEREDLRAQERRKETRHKLILRAGVLEQQGTTSFCLVKNISSAGVQLKFYTRPALNGEATLRIADEPPVTGRIAWIRDETAGVSFDQELDSATLLRVRQKLSPARRRAFPRVSVEASALVRAHGRALAATVCDISSLGARIRTGAKLEAGDRAILHLAGLPPITAYVRWTMSESREAGIAFATPIPIQIIAQWVDGRMRVFG